MLKQVYFRAFTPKKGYEEHIVKKTSFKGHFEIKDACRYTDLIDITFVLSGNSGTGPNGSQNFCLKAG